MRVSFPFLGSLAVERKKERRKEGRREEEREREREREREEIKIVWLWLNE